MKSIRITLLAMIAIGLVFSGVFAADVAKGKALFNDPKLGGGTSGKSCNSCHPDGKGLMGGKKEYVTPAPGGKKKTHKTLEEAVNWCIEMALKGKAIDPKGEDMANIVAYINSLKAEMPMKKEMPKKKKAIEGC
jgi:cytochrome c